METGHYLSKDGSDPFQYWLDRLDDLKGRVAVLRRVDRLARGNTGDWKSVGHGVRELRVDVGPGYRVYFSRVGSAIVPLLGGGAKRTQRADIELAIARWREYRRRPR